MDDSPRLPLEILEHVIDHTDRKTCLSCALVCWALVDQSRRCAFRTIDVVQAVYCSDTVTFLAFDTLVNHAGCTFTQHVREVLLGRPFLFDDSALEPLDWLRRMPNITTLKLTGRPALPMAKVPDIWPQLGRMPCLTILDLHGIVFVDLAAFVSMLSMLPSLLDLSLREIYIDGIKDDPRIDDAESAITNLISRVPTTQFLSKLNQLHIGLLRTNALGLLFPALLSVTLAQYPPITRIHLQLPPSDADVTAALCKLLRRLSSTLNTIHVHFGKQDVDAAELARLDFAQFTQLRSFTMERLCVNLWPTNPFLDLWGNEFGSSNRRSIDLLHAVLQAPALQSLTVYLLVAYSAVQEQRTDTIWETLDNRMDQLPLLEKVELLISLTPARQPTLDIGHTVISRIHKLLPKARSRGILFVYCGMNREKQTP
ncbi:hypothetical protein BD626DRAFT_496520 [Schizophyllum amplum]|uniref:F-box domain-containing protein n=1 Tax=Schizophyllum amplum TaxID=97359 RepID=A0A550CDM3_9AGAR|nr:hypothetical protein BD626DRAFT_496520 [Auriculariopsis ampla]